MNFYDYFTLVFLCSSSLLLILFFILYKKDSNYLSFVGFFMTFCIISTGISATFARDLDKNKVLGFHYITQCKLLEINIDNGFLSSNTNKIDCNGIIDNVNTEDYNKAILTYQDSLK